MKDAIRSAAAGNFERYEVNAKSGQGDLIPIDFSLKPIMDADGNVINLIAEGRDISERRKAEQALRRNQAELELIFNGIPMWIFFKDDKNTILRLNQSAADSLGKTVEGVEGLNTYDLYPEFAKKYHDDDLAVIRSGQPKLGIVEEYVTDEGHRGWVRTDKVPYIDPEAVLPGFLNAGIESLNLLLDAATYTSANAALLAVDIPIFEISGRDGQLGALFGATAFEALTFGIPGSELGTARYATRPVKPLNNIRELQKYFDETGYPIYPPNRGFDGGISIFELQPGTTIDRYGGRYFGSDFVDPGTFVAPEGTPFGQRSLLEFYKNSPFRSYEVLQPISGVCTGPALPWFGQVGGGIQQELPLSIDYLVKNGFIRPKG